MSGKPHYAGADWIYDVLGKELSPFGTRVADIIGIVTRGIYHVSDEVKKIEWDNDHFIEWRTHKSMATYDFGTLTELVVLAHDRAIRIEIEPCSRTTLRVMFHPRKKGGASLSLWERHPELEHHVEVLRSFHEEEV
jgi:hypothetical protein